MYKPYFDRQGDRVVIKCQINSTENSLKHVLFFNKKSLFLFKTLYLFLTGVSVIFFFLRWNGL